MHLGIFAKTFPRPNLEETLDAVVRHGLGHVQFNLACAGLASMPESIDPDLCDRIHAAHAERNLVMAAVSGTFNMAHPDPAKRREGLQRLGVLARAARRLGTSIVTLSTGTRHPTDLWTAHPDNSTPAAWRDLVSTMREAVRIAADAEVTLAFEPEVSNVVDSAVRARRLLDELGSRWLRVVLDGANLFHSGDLARMADVLDEAFELLGTDIVLAHAKDLSRDGQAGHEAAGTGALDYDHYLRALASTGFDGALILHGLAEAEVDHSVAFLKNKLSAVRTG